MPYLHIKVSGIVPDADAAHGLQAAMTALIAETLGKRKDVTAVVVEPVSGFWMIGGTPVSIAAHMDVLITAGTNSAEEKAQFIRGAHGLLSAFLGTDMPEATYVALHEPTAESWGYAGISQAARRVLQAAL